MKWMLVVLVRGGAPFKTELLYDTLAECLFAEEAVRLEYGAQFNVWLRWAAENPELSNYPASDEFQQGRIGLLNRITCIRHAAS